MSIKKFLGQEGLTYLWTKILDVLSITVQSIDEIKVNKEDFENTMTSYYTKDEVNEYHSDLEEYVDYQVTALVNSAPETLDTLGELAIAFEENADMVETLNAAIVNKAENSDLENTRELVDLNATAIEDLQTRVLSNSLILLDAITGESYTIQIQNGQLVSFPTV